MIWSSQKVNICFECFQANEIFKRCLFYILKIEFSVTAWKGFLGEGDAEGSLAGFPPLKMLFCPTTNWLGRVITIPLPILAWTPANQQPQADAQHHFLAQDLYIINHSCSQVEIGKKMNDKGIIQTRQMHTWLFKMELHKGRIRSLWAIEITNWTKKFPCFNLKSSFSDKKVRKTWHFQQTVVKSIIVGKCWTCEGTRNKKRKEGTRDI